jgi:hypothetical protein
VKELETYDFAENLHVRPTEETPETDEREHRDQLFQSVIKKSLEIKKPEVQ